MNYRTAVIKRNIELIGMFPFVIVGKLAGYLFKLKTEHHIFLFFPCAEYGGSIKVNADIAECIKDSKPLIIFSKKPKNDGLRSLYEIDGVRILDLHKFIDNKLFHFVNFFFRGVIASWVNSAENPVIFGGECIYFYKILPHVKKETRKIELCHLSTWFNFSQAFVKYIDMRIFSTPQIKREVEDQYRRNQVPEQFSSRLMFADNQVDIPPLEINDNSITEVIFVGRGALQKRVHLIAETARRMHEMKKNIHFSFVGDVESNLSDEVKKIVTLHGSLSKDDLYAVYADADILLLLSAYEGLPIVVMDMMARGKVVISTAVGGIPDYIAHGETGFLIECRGEHEIVTKAIEYLTILIENKELKHKIQHNAYEFARTRFGADLFCKTYRRLLLFPSITDTPGRLQAELK